MTPTTFLIQEPVAPKPRRYPRCGWTHCSFVAVGGAYSEKDREWTLPLCSSHLYGLSFGLWSKKEPA